MRRSSVRIRPQAPAKEGYDQRIALPSDGLIRLTRGQRSWVAPVEVKTGRNNLDVDQVTTYLDVARQHEYDAVITISHDVATTPGVHSVPVDRCKTLKVDLK